MNFASQCENLNIIMNFECQYENLDAQQNFTEDDQIFPNKIKVSSENKYFWKNDLKVS